MPRARIHHAPQPKRLPDGRYQLNFEAGTELRKRLRSYAARTEGKLYVIIREAVEEYLERRGA